MGRLLPPCPTLHTFLIPLTPRFPSFLSLCQLDNQPLETELIITVSPMSLNCFQFGLCDPCPRWGLVSPSTASQRGSKPNQHQLGPQPPRSNGQLYRRPAADGQGGSPGRLGLTQLGCQRDCDMPRQDRRPGRQAGRPDFQE